jgi:hypothetical protein
MLLCCVRRITACGLRAALVVRGLRALAGAGALPRLGGFVAARLAYGGKVAR